MAPQGTHGPSGDTWPLGVEALGRRMHSPSPETKHPLDPSQTCMNGCNRRGTCISGFCHCNPGEEDLAANPDEKEIYNPGEEVVLLSLSESTHPEHVRIWI